MGTNPLQKWPYSRPPRPRRFRPWAEALEGRTLPAMFNPLISAGDVVTDPASLRASVIRANANGQDDVFNLQAGVYALTRGNTSGQENAAAEGDLDLTEAGHTVTFQGAGAGITVIDAGGLFDRAFQVFANVTVVFRDLTIRNG